MQEDPQTSFKACSEDDFVTKRGMVIPAAIIPLMITTHVSKTIHQQVTLNLLF